MSNTNNNKSDETFCEPKYTILYLSQRDFLVFVVPPCGFRFPFRSSCKYSMSNSLAAGQVGSEVQRVPGKNVQRCTPAVQRGHVRD